MMKIGTKDPRTMTASQINKEVNEIDTAGSSLNEEFIAAGRGHEMAFDTMKMTDPLAMRYREMSNRRGLLKDEVEARTGNRMTPMPTGRGFGPRKS